MEGGGDICLSPTSTSAAQELENSRPGSDASTRRVAPDAAESACLPTAEGGGITDSAHFGTRVCSWIHLSESAWLKIVFHLVTGDASDLRPAVLSKAPRGSSLINKRSPIELWAGLLSRMCSVLSSLSVKISARATPTWLRSLDPLQMNMEDVEIFGGGGPTEAHREQQLQRDTTPAWN